MSEAPDYSRPWFMPDGSIESGCSKCYGKGYWLVHTIPNVTPIYDTLGDFVGLADKRLPVKVPCTCKAVARFSSEPGATLVEQSTLETTALHWFLNSPKPPPTLILSGPRPRKIADPAAFMAQLLRRFNDPQSRYAASKDILALYRTMVLRRAVTGPVAEEEDAFSELASDEDAFAPEAPVEEDAFADEDALGPDEVMEEDAFL